MKMPVAKGPSILIVVEASALSRWVLKLAETLEKAWQSQVDIRVTEGAANPALEILLSLEKMIFRGHRPVWADRLAPSDVQDRLETPDASPELVIDLRATGDGEWPAGTTVLRPAFNGAFGETALASVLFFHGTPNIEIVARQGGAEPFVAAQGVASLEASQGVGGAMEAVWSRVVALIFKACLSPKSAQVPTSDETPAAGRITTPAIAIYGAKAVAAAAARAAYRLCCHAPHWRIGWRRAEAGNDVWSRRDLGGGRWKVLADPGDHFYADPFSLHWQGRDYLFFEDLDHKTGKGIISVSEFGDDGRPGEAMPVLEEPWHLSYPFLIEQNGEIYMVPESSLSGQISLYRAAEFPHRWEKHTVLVDNIEAADATIIRHDGRFFMFAVVRDGTGGYSDTLAIWQAQKLFGPWTAHPQNPVLVDDRSARPAGNMVVRDGALWRPVQDCRGGYGAALGLARIGRLDAEGFEQTVETVLSPNPDWPGRKLHTLNFNGRIETIDGSVIRPKFAPLAHLVEARYRPGG